MIKKRLLAVCGLSLNLLTIFSFGRQNVDQIRTKTISEKENMKSASEEKQIEQAGLKDSKTQLMNVSNSSKDTSSITMSSNGNDILVLSGDIGGTNCRLNISKQSSKGPIVSIATKTYSVIENKNIVETIIKFLKEHNIAKEKISGICIAVAGVISDNSVKLTNGNWIIKVKHIQDELNIENVTLINDFEAIGYSIPTLKTSDLYVMQEGFKEERGLKAIVGAGTGLGQSFLTWNNALERYDVHSTEGGHTSFAPADDVQIDILKYLRNKYGHVSTERLLSGPGIFDIYNYFVEKNPFGDKQNDKLNNILAGTCHSPAAEISKYAIEYRDPMALRTMDVFVKIYGQKVGDSCYSLLPRGGMYIAGGIAPKILKHMLESNRFMSSFTDKGRLSELLKTIPIYIVLNQDVGLEGARNYALNVIRDKNLSKK